MTIDMSTLIFKQHFTAFMYVDSANIDLGRIENFTGQKREAALSPKVLVCSNYHSRAGKRVDLMVEQIGGSMFIHRYRLDAWGKHKCEFNSRSEALLNGRQTFWSVGRRLEVQHYTERTCQLHHWLTFILLDAPEVLQTDCIEGLTECVETHFKNETVWMAENIERLAAGYQVG